MNLQNEPAAQKEVIFDESGQTIAEVSADETEVEASADDSVSVEAAETPESAPANTHKYRIGNATFATQEEALTYAQSQVSALETEAQVANAYRQGMIDAASPAAPAESVTPAAPADDLNTEELYTNPQAFLNRYATKIKTETRAEIEARESQRAQSDQIWREFTDRHPALADFRTDVENFTAQNLTTVRAIISTKGHAAGYDFIATKLKSRFEQYANALKPKRELPNVGAGASPSSRAPGVTPKPAATKELSFAEQIRSIRKRR